MINENGAPFMGSGPLRLLEKIKVLKSINKASKEMNLSYVKALKMLNRLEKNLGCQLLVRKRGGNDRGGTVLTPFAERYIEFYRELQKNVRNRADEEMQMFLEKIGREKRNASH